MMETSVIVCEQMEEEGGRKEGQEKEGGHKNASGSNRAKLRRGNDI